MRSIHSHPESESEKLLHQGSHHHKASRTTSTCRAPWQYPREKSEECRAGPKARCGMRMMHETRCETSQIHIRTLSNGDCHSKQPPLALSARGRLTGCRRGYESYRKIQSFYMISNQFLCLRSPRARTAPPPAPRGTVFIVWTRVDFLVSLVARFYSYSGPRSLGECLEATCMHGESEAT